MPNHKTARHCEIKPWLSAKADNKDGRFIQIGNSLLLSEKFNALSPSARMLYFGMAMESGGRIEFTLPRNSAKKYGISPATFSRAVADLQAAGFISVNSGYNVREKNIYRFDLSWKESK